MPQLTLKIDVDTYRGTREGVPNLVRLLNAHRANATFLFSLGPDHTGWALRRALRPGFFQKVSRTSVLEHYGLKTLMYGVLLPGPDIGKRCAGLMRGVRDAGFECGIHTWDHVKWQDSVRQQNARWTSDQMRLSYERFIEIFETAPATHGAAGWQMNGHAFEQLDRGGIVYASDSRAELADSGALVDPAIGPYRLESQSGAKAPLACVQMPSTLPTLDELLGRTIDGRLIDEGAIAGHLLSLTEEPRDHVYTLHAELEGQKLAPIFEQLLEGWKRQGYTLGSMAEHHARIKDFVLPVRPLRWGSVPGRSGDLILA
ncbi:MAG: polysaccharide deacetylase family protein [Janthinobacterium lividum]